MSIESSTMENLKSMTPVSDSLMAELLGISEKTLSQIPITHIELDSVINDRFFRITRVAALAVEVLESEAGARAWLRRPQIGLGEQSPISLLTTHTGIDEVEKLLLRIEHSVSS